MVSPSPSGDPGSLNRTKLIERWIDRARFARVCRNLDGGLTLAAVWSGVALSGPAFLVDSMPDKDFNRYP